MWPVGPVRACGPHLSFHTGRMIANLSKTALYVILLR